MARYQSTQNSRACVVFTDNLHCTEVAGPSGEVKSNSAAMPLQLKMFHIRGPDIEGRQICPVRSSGCQTSEIYLHI